MSRTQPKPHASRAVIVSAWAVPVLVVGQFAMLAVVPVVVVLVGALRDARLRAFRPWAVALAATYAVPLIMRATGPTPGLSLSRSMSPVVTALLVAVSVVVAVAWHVVVRRRSADPAVTA